MSLSDDVLDVARDLREIVTLHGELEAEAVHKATDREMPGGDAMVMLGPVANLEAWNNMLDGAERWNASTDRTPIDLSHIDDEDPEWEPPLQTLLFWSEQWRVEHGREMDGRPDEGTEAAFLAQVLNWAWENEPHFEEFAKDVAKAKRRIENVLREGVRVTRGIVCVCRGGALIRTDHPKQGLLDEWSCKHCGLKLEISQYHAHVMRDYVEHADWLPAPFVERRTNVRAGTVRVWANRGHVKSRKDERGQTVYCIEDIEARLAQPDDAA